MLLMMKELKGHLRLLRNWIPVFTGMTSFLRNRLLHKECLVPAIGYLERVTGTLVEYRINKRNKVTKSETIYYDLTRKGRLLMRQFSGRVEVNLKPPYKQF